MPRIPPPRACVECGRSVGRAWKEYQLCDKCGQLTIDDAGCTCRNVEDYDPECPVHKGRNPYDIPF